MGTSNGRKKILKGEGVLFISNYKKPKSDKTFFSNAFFNFGNKTFVSKDTKIILHRELFDGERTAKDNTNELEKKKINNFKGKNEPRVYGSSSSGNNRKTIINKGIFTTCKKNDNCPPWSMKAKKITHDKLNKNIIYISLVSFLFLLAHFVLNNIISFNSNYLENSLKNFLLSKSFLQIFVIKVNE